MKLLDSLTSSQRLKLRVISWIYSLGIKVEKHQFKKGTSNTKVLKRPFTPGQDEPKKLRFNKYKIERWSKYIPGVELATPFLIPVSHMPAIGYTVRTVLAKLLLEISYTVKSNLSPKGILSLRDSESPFIVADKEDIWISDQQFALRVVQGASPQTIRKALADDRVLARLDKDLLYKLTGNADYDVICQRIFVLDYSIFEGLQAKENFLSVAPQALFFQPDGNALLQPIAISLSGEDDNMYTPLDSKEAWIFAKLAVLQCEVIYMPLINHVVEAHLWMDPVIIATDFHLPQGHPVHSLMQHHFKVNYAINKVAYYLLLKPRAFFDEVSQYSQPDILELLRRGVTNFHISKRIVPADIEERNVDSIGYYPYRDDTRLLWAALKTYVESYLKIYYPAMQVEHDTFLQNWRARIKKELGIDDSLSLTDLLTAILFNVYDHNIHQNSIVDAYLDPYHATALLGTIPKSKQEVTEAFLYKCLADVKSKVGRGCLIRAITAQTEVFAPPVYDDPELNKVNDALRASLKAIEEKLTENNNNRIKPYTSVYPSKIDNSIKI